jgi:hypothetical protein
MPRCIAGSCCQGSEKVARVGQAQGSQHRETAGARIKPQPADHAERAQQQHDLRRRDADPRRAQPAERGEAANNRDCGHTCPGRRSFIADCRQLPAPGEQQQQARNGEQR